MHDKGNSPDWTTAAADEKDQRAVLNLVLDRHPVQLTIEELIRDLAQGREVDFTDTDPVERAVEALAGVGLLHRTDGSVRPTLAAVHFHNLSQGA